VCHFTKDPMITAPSKSAVGVLILGFLLFATTTKAQFAIVTNNVWFRTFMVKSDKEADCRLLSVVRFPVALHRLKTFGFWTESITRASPAVPSCLIRSGTNK
jgi:hypothetical protein